MKTKTLFDLPDFRTIFTSAKKIAELSGGKELEPMHVAKSLVVLYEQAGLKTQIEEQLVQDLSKLTEHVVVDPHLVREAPIDGDLPVAEKTKDLIQRCHEPSLQRILDDVRKQLEEEKAKREDPDQTGFGELNPYYCILIERASCIAREKGRTAVELLDIGQASFQLECFFAENRLTDVCFMIKSHAFLRRLLTVKAPLGLNELDVVTPNDSLPLGEDAKKKLDSARKSHSAFLTFVNAGINALGALHLKTFTAYHEAGHAVISMILAPERTIEKVSIQTQPDSDGHVAFSDQNYWSIKSDTRSDFLVATRVLMAGRLAELQYSPNDHGYTAGSHSDVELATDYLSRSIWELGMNNTLGFVALKNIPRRSGSFSILSVAAELLLAIELRRAYKDTARLVKKHWNMIERVASALLVKETLLLKDLVDLADPNYPIAEASGAVACVRQATSSKPF